MADALAHAYLQLPLGERHAALTSLVRSLTRREQALLQSLISDTRDPFHRLPTELLLHVFDFLHPFHVWSKRLVCRRWNNSLSLDVYTRTALDRFDTHDPADSALDARTQEYPQTLALRHILALRSGQPSSYVSLDDQFAFLPYSYPVAHQLRLKGKRIAYLRGNGQTREGNVVVVRDLTTGETTTLCGTARENIILIELTSDIVAFFTYTGIMYVAPLLSLTDSLQSIRLPSSSILVTGSYRETIVCILSGARAPAAVIYDTATKRTSSFQLRALQHDNAALDRKAVSMNTHGQGFEIFSADKSAELRVQVSRYSFDGDCVDQTSLTVSHGSVADCIVSLGPAHPTGERGTCQLTLSYRLPQPGSPPTHLNSFCYTARRTLLFDTFTFTLKSIDLTGNDGDPAIASNYPMYDPIEYPKPALWKDRLYRAAEYNLDSGPQNRPASLLDTARRPGPLDGPHTLYHMSDDSRATPNFPIHDSEAEDEAIDFAAARNCNCACHLQRALEVYPWHHGKAWPTNPRQGSPASKKQQRLISAFHAEPGSSSSLQFQRKQQSIPPAKIAEKYMSPPRTVPEPDNMSPEGEAEEEEEGEEKPPPPPPPLHTIVAINDSFAVATTLDPNKIAVLCFDERVLLHGGATKISCMNLID